MSAHVSETCTTSLKDMPVLMHPAIQAQQQLHQSAVLAERYTPAHTGTCFIISQQPLCSAPLKFNSSNGGNSTN